MFGINAGQTKSCSWIIEVDKSKVSKRSHVNLIPKTCYGFTKFKVNILYFNDVEWTRVYAFLPNIPRDQFVFVYRNLRLPCSSKLCTLFLGARII